MSRADRLIASAESAARRYSNDDFARGAYHVGLMRADVRTLCAELEQYANPSKLPHHYTVERDGIEYQVGASFDRWDHGEPLNVDSCEVYIRGMDVSLLLSVGLRDDIEADALHQYEAEAADAADDAAIEAYCDREAERSAAMRDDYEAVSAAIAKATGGAS